MHLKCLGNIVSLSYKKNQQASIRIFCFHYAGGGASFCRDWVNHLSTDIEVIAIQLPGREQRYAEPYYTRMKPLISELSRVIQGYLNKPYIFFGHSLGAIIGYELIRELKRLKLRQPEIFVPSSL